MKIAVCALTFRRRDGLARLLEGLNRLIFRRPLPEIQVTIVDNDPAGSGRAVCERLRPALRWPLLYIVEPQRGLAAARNAALDSAGNAEWLCFVDDDEVPQPVWLDELLRVQSEYEADVVGGPVVPYFPEPVADWVVRGRFFDRRRYATGTALPHAFTNNVLFRRRLVDDLHLRFDPRWALTGGEDRHFFQRIGMAGYRIVWADDAVVEEWVPPHRATPSWLVRRHYRVGNCTSLVERDLRPAWRVLPTQAGKGLVWIMLGLGQLAVSPVRGRHVQVRARRALAYGAGLLTGLLGMPFREYGHDTRP